MIFNCYEFIFLFLPATLLLYYTISKRYQNHVLTISSFIFYGNLNLHLCFLLALSVIVNYSLGLKINSSLHQSDKKNFLILLLIINLSILAFFKYTNFFIESILAVIPLADFTPLYIILPAGISFYTFQGISYGIDIYRNDSKPVKNFFDFSCYISFFPQLIAGPIVRFKEINSQLTFRDHSSGKFCYGIKRFSIGLFKKVIIADTMGGIFNYYYTSQLDLPTAWLIICAFSLQIYFDFSGYSDMAVGLGSMFGFTLPENFNRPYTSIGIWDFWRKWHMSLSGWIRDYIYIPMGGSKVSKSQWMINILVAFSLCGLWHGASWNFVLWGVYFGFLMIAERPFRGKTLWMPSFIVKLKVYIFVLFGWVLFKTTTISECISYFNTMFFGDFRNEWDLTFIQSATFVIIFLVITLMGYENSLENKLKGPFHNIVIFMMLFLAITVVLGNKNSPFLYYQF